MKPAPILDKSFVWHSSASHDAGSDAFRERQKARMAAAQAERAKAQAAVVTNIGRKVGK